MPIEVTHIIFSLAIIVGSSLFVFFLQRPKNLDIDSLETTSSDIKQILQNYGDAVTAYQKTRAERCADLELCATRTAEEEEELLILCGQEAHDIAVRTQPIPTMIQIVSPLMKVENEKYHAMMVEKLGSCPPVSPPWLSRTPNVMRWEASARPAAAAHIGSLFCYLSMPNAWDETQNASYLLLRVNTPERWIHMEITHCTSETGEDLASIVSAHTGEVCSELIFPPPGPIREMVWKPLSKVWTRSY